MRELLQQDSNLWITYPLGNPIKNPVSSLCFEQPVPNHTHVFRSNSPVDARKSWMRSGFFIIKSIINTVIRTWYTVENKQQLDPFVSLDYYIVINTLENTKELYL